ncbi:MULTISPECIES: hypothetical protein [Flavobacterium]|uniref:Lipoprotein n=1 Tax=Flavobacterium ranwuense TaxID=2541725 RepID=A0ABY2DT46_9FLAO|nr:MULTISPECIES: hypothetical protein [Flavobacterium]TDE28901.1 hypothetical protein E0I61_10960 [Flavobacterium ranwuense]TDE52907.1 hypothetical protein E0H99_09485 [Flavobacterium sp. GT3P67]
MKTKIYVSIITLLILITSCNVIDDLLTFSIDNQTSFKIESGFPLGTAHNLITPDVTTNSSSTFENNNTKAELVKDVKLSELKLTITDPSNKSFSFLKSIRLYISTDANDEIELAYLDEINSTSNTINLTCTKEKLDKYIKASSYKIRIKVVTKESLAQDITVKSDMKFKVTADPF